MTAKAIVSVIIPAFNRESYLAQAIDSVLGQTYGNVELIVVDDGSTDGTFEILRTYADRISVLTHPRRENRGQSASINLGLSKAAGEYIAVLDSDDYWALEKLEAQVGFLESHPEFGLVYCNGLAVNEKGEFLYRIYGDHHREENVPGSLLLDCYLFVPTNSLVRRSVYDRVGGYDESMRSAQDHDMAVRIAEVTQLGYFDKVLFFYRRHANSISTKNAMVRWKTGFRILEKARRRWNYPRRIVRKRLALLHFRMYQCLMEEAALARAVGHLLMAGVLDPHRGLQVLLGRERTAGVH